MINHLIEQLVSHDNTKGAASVIKEFKLSIDDFPDLKEKIEKQTMRYFLGRFLNKRPTNDDYLSLDRLEDLFHGFKPMLSYLVEDLVYRNKLNEAKGVCLRHGLIGLPYMREETAYELQNVVYDQKKDPIPYDVFGPLSDGKYISLPPHVKVEWISTLDDI